MRRRGSESEAKGQAQAQAQPRLAPLDSLRALSAALIVFAALGVPTLGFTGDVGGGADPWLLSASAAAVVFLVLSGFSIHASVLAARARGEALDTPSFFLRRFFRLIIPVSAAVLLAMASVPDGAPALGALLSILMFYALYPALLTLRGRLPSWRPLIGVSFLLALLVATTQPDAPDYASFGLGLAAVLAAPCWLLGCHLAEVISGAGAAARMGRGTLWWIRGFALMALILCGALRDWAGVGALWTLNLFAVAATVWIYAEIKSAAQTPPPLWLEKAGLMSFSVFLTHGLAIAGLGAVLGPAQAGPLGWALTLAAIAAAAFLFHALVEAPCRQLARQLSVGSERRKSGQAG